MIRRCVCLALALCAVVTLVCAVPASAQTPNPNSNYQGCQAFLSDVTVVQGQSVTISGSGANPRDRVTAEIDRTDGAFATGIADSNGNFSFAGTVPSATKPGSQTLTVTCGPDGGPADILITVRTTGGGTPVTPGGGGHDDGSLTTGGAGAGNGSPGGAGVGAGTGSLPRTGAGNLIPLLRLGIALVAAGGLVLAASRRRRWARDLGFTD